MACFDDCGSTCYEWSSAFDKAIASETRFDITLRELLDSHAGWYFDGDLDPVPGDIDGLGLQRTSGVYILWQQVGYCDVHDSEHMHAQYVGKAGRGVGGRLKRHQAEKLVGNGLTTEVSVLGMINRQAKYVEQLLLDIYDFPLNGSENTGAGTLCHCISPAEWN